jgi:hypothetical protein
MLGVSELEDLETCPFLLLMLLGGMMQGLRLCMLPSRSLVQALVQLWCSSLCPGKAAPPAASSTPSGCIGHKGCGSAFAYDGIPIRPEIAGPGIRLSRGSGRNTMDRPGDFSLLRLFRSLPFFPGDEHQTAQHGLRTTATDLRNRNMTILRPFRVPN